MMSITQHICTYFFSRSFFVPIDTKRKFVRSCFFLSNVFRCRRHPFLLLLSLLLVSICSSRSNPSFNDRNTGTCLLFSSTIVTKKKKKKFKNKRNGKHSPISSIKIIIDVYMPMNLDISYYT
jgi:hypothetical protein